MNKIWRVWKYALGSFADDKTSEYDNVIAIVRTFIFITYLITNCFIISGVIRHWNPRFHNNIHNNKEAGTHGTSRSTQSKIPRYTQEWERNRYEQFSRP